MFWEFVRLLRNINGAKRKRFFCIFFTLFLFESVFAQIVFSGAIKNYAKQPLTLFLCYKDTLLKVDSVYTDKNGEFVFHSASLVNKNFSVGLYKITLQNGQFFYLLANSLPVKISTVYSPNPFYNIATDSLSILPSENKEAVAKNMLLYEFQRLQKDLNVSMHFLLQMMRLYPIYDSFHEKIVEEYFKRYAAMEQFIQTQMEKPGRKEGLIIALAYYQPVNPDWKQPDPWRDSIFANHYFDYFNPADSFYLYTNILPEKMDIYLALKTNKRDDYGQPVYDQKLFSDAAASFIDKTVSNRETYFFCISYYLKKFEKEHKDQAFLSVYDQFLKPAEGDCGAAGEKDDAAWHWARKKADVLRNLQIGNFAPDFVIHPRLNLSSVKSEYILLIFWASWCPHCTEILPAIKKTLDEFNSKPVAGKSQKLITPVAISLDTNYADWKKFVDTNSLQLWNHSSEFKGWKGEVPGQYNVYATPSMFLLDKEMRIIAKPETPLEIESYIDEKNSR